MKFNRLEMNPAKNPAVLDTGTWDALAARQIIKALGPERLSELYLAIQSDSDFPFCEGMTAYKGSLATKDGQSVLLVQLGDGQQVFLELAGANQPYLLGEPVAQVDLDGARRVAIQKTDAAIVDRYFREIHPEKGSRALASTPRLGIGVRMTTSCWPAILEAMEKKNFSANLIQNSVRELNFLDNLLEAQPPETNYACGFGTIETGYTGSSFEGLWLAGVLEALKYPKTLAYGADADHLQIKRGTDGMARAKQYIDSCQYYSFYTLDMADILSYAALSEPSDAVAADLAKARISNATLRSNVLKYHTKPCRIDGKDYVIPKSLLDRLIAKYWEALNVLEELTAYIQSLKQGQPFDVEFTIDEHPPEIAAFACLTSDEEYLFVLREIQRRGLQVSHVAPNFGVEKGFDYRCPDGLKGFEKRVSSQFHIAEHFGVMVDFHSADDLTAPTREVIQRATGGKHHYKISPMLQIIYARVLSQYHPDLFRLWWEDAKGYAGREAAAGSVFAQECMAEYENCPDKSPSVSRMLFHHYSFAFVGKRDQSGQFLHREKFYDLSEAFYREYQHRLISYLGNLADDLF